MLDFLRRLKQRKLVQWSLAYIAAAFSLIQVVDVVADSYDWPHLVMHLVFGVLVVGFVVMLLLVWYHGERGAQHLSGAELLLIALALAIGGGLLWHFGREGSPPAVAMRSPDGARHSPGYAAPNSAVATARSPGTALEAAGPGLQAARPAPQTVQPIPTKSIAVLPFVNESGNEDQQYFSDGLSEDLITALSQFAGLKVISPDSSFQFRHSKDSSAQIGAMLGVAHLLEGSVQRAGGEVRISATLVDAADGTTLWSHHYDRPYRDLFQLQDDITRAVTAVLKTKLLVAPGAVVQSDRPPSGNLAAWTAYQHGNTYFALDTKAGFHQAIDAFTKATHLDPKYAAAYAQLAYTLINLAEQFQGGSKAERTNAKARTAVTTALRLDPDSSLAHQAHALMLAVDMDWTGAEVEAQRALQLAPDDAAAQFSMAYALASLGRNRRAVELIRRALDSNPRHGIWYLWLGLCLAARDRLNQARQAAGTAISLQPGTTVAHELLATIEILRGDAKAALTAAQKEPPGSWHEAAMALALQIGANRKSADAVLKKLITDYANVAAYQIAEVYALRKDPDDTFKWLDRAWTNRDPGIDHLLSDPLILRYRNDPRFAAFCRKVGLPTSTDAIAMR